MVGSRKSTTFALAIETERLILKVEVLKTAEIAQLVEHNLAKVGVASSSLVFRSLRQHTILDEAHVAEW